MLNGFTLSRFSFVLKARDPLVLPAYKGSTFCGGFGNAFKKVVCTIKGETCDDCLLREKCIYSYIFETPPPADTQILRKYEKAPHPFVIEPPLETQRVYKPGDSLTFQLLLIGKAVDYLPYFIYTFEELEELGEIGIGKGRGSYELREVNFDEEPIYNSTDRRLRSLSFENTHSVLSLSGREGTNGKGAKGLRSSPSRIALNFLTPTRIVVNEDLVVDLEFHHLIRNLLRRISTLSYFHCGKRLDLDFKVLIERAKKIETKDRDLKWYDWERYSARQGTRMRLGGFTGKVSFVGDLGEFIPFIKLGELLHVGKGTSFGLGRYSVGASAKSQKQKCKEINLSVNNEKN